MTIRTLTRPAGTGTLAAVLTKSEILSRVADTIGTYPKGVTYRSLWNVEGDLAKLQATKLDGTIMEQVAHAAEANGIPIGDQSLPMGQRTVGDVMKGVPLSQDEVNYAACHCVNGSEMTNERAAANLRHLAGKC